MTEQPITIDQIAALRWTEDRHVDVMGAAKMAGAVRALAERLLEEVARANSAEQDARNAIRERDAAHREVADRTVEVRATEKLCDGLARQRDERTAAARTFSAVVTSYMLGDVDGGVVSRAQTALAVALGGAA